MRIDPECAATLLPASSDATILELASRVSHAANEYRTGIDERVEYRHVLRLSGILARAADELTSAIADAYAEHDGLDTSCVRATLES